MGAIELCSSDLKASAILAGKREPFRKAIGSMSYLVVLKGGQEIA